MPISMRLIIISIVSFLFLLPTPGHAKCAFALYEVKGSLALPEDLKPEEVRVYLFLAGTLVTSAYPPGPDEEDYATPNAEGVFQAAARLNTSSGYSRLFGDRCRRAEVRGDLFITGDRIRSWRVKVKFQQSKAEIRRTRRAQAIVEEISVELLPQGE